jgi:hypothetical protein
MGVMFLSNLKLDEMPSYSRPRALQGVLSPVCYRVEKDRPQQLRRYILDANRKVLEVVDLSHVKKAIAVVSRRKEAPRYGLIRLIWTSCKRTTVTPFRR